jgi:hypothetical protein
MVELVGATVVADSVISWAIGEGLTTLVQWAKLAVRCKSKCAALADLLAGQQLRAVAHNLDSLTQAQAFAQVRAQYDRLCEQLEEAQYVVLRCRQTDAWDIVTRVRMGRRIEAVHGALEATTKELAVNVPTALHQDRAIKAQLESDAQAARDRASLLMQGDQPPLQPQRGAVRRAASVREPQPPQVVFQHLDALVPRLCAELPHHRVHDIVGMPGLGKTIVATAVYERAKDTFQRHCFLPVGKQADVLRILRGVFQSVYPGSRVRWPALLRWPSCVQLAPAAPASSALQDFAFLVVIWRACIQRVPRRCNGAPRQVAQSHPKAPSKAMSRLLICKIARCRCRKRLRTRRAGASGLRRTCRRAPCCSSSTTSGAARTCGCSTLPPRMTAATRKARSSSPRATSASCTTSRATKLVAFRSRGPTP